MKMDSKKDAKKANISLVEENKKLKFELDKARKETEDFKNKYLRALADYQNYEKRVREEKEQIGHIANTGIILKLLPFLDNLDKAEIFIRDDGLKIVKEKFYQILKELGLEEIQVLGKPFDPHIVEAIEVVEGKEDNIVRGVLRKGYMYNGKVLRVAHVKVTRHSAGHPEDPPAGGDEGSH